MMCSFPEPIAAWIDGTPLTDVSGMSGDKTYFLDKSGGAYLKTGARGSLAQAADMQRYWAARGLSADVIMYVSADQDYMLTAPVPGKSCAAEEHIAQPERLCRVLGRALRRLHGAGCEDCARRLTDELSARAADGKYSQSHLDALSPFAGASHACCAGAEVNAGAALLRNDALLHGDACLPNIMLDGWRLSGFVDVGDSGVGDRHYDIAWALWSIMHNLRDPRWGEAFLDAYGRELIDRQRLRICALLSAME